MLLYYFPFSQKPQQQLHCQSTNKFIIFLDFYMQHCLPPPPFCNQTSYGTSQHYREESTFFKSCLIHWKRLTLRYLHTFLPCTHFYDDYKTHFALVFFPWILSVIIFLVSWCRDDGLDRWVCYRLTLTKSAPSHQAKQANEYVSKRADCIASKAGKTSSLGPLFLLQRVWVAEYVRIPGILVLETGMPFSRLCVPISAELWLLWIGSFFL